MTETQLNVKHRILWIDCAKGISMLLVIFSHSVHGALRGAIFSFHMPLFFVLSCMTYRYSENFTQWKSKTKKAADHLLKPALLLFLLTVAVEGTTALLEGRLEAIDEIYFFRKLLTLLFASGARFSINGVDIDRLGIPWFLIALFLGRSLHDLIQLRIKGFKFTVICSLLTVIGVMVGQVLWLPFSLDVALAAMFFMLCGQWLKNVDMTEGAVRKMTWAAIVWASGVVLTKIFGGSYLELAIRRYPLFPICYGAALAGTMMVSAFSVIATEYGGKFIAPLLICGENSLMLLCVHTMDFMWARMYVGVSGNTIVSAVCRIVLDLVIFFMLLIIKKSIKKSRDTI